jgi:hypothetical protein
MDKDRSQTYPGSDMHRTRLSRLICVFLVPGTLLCAGSAWATEWRLGTERLNLAPDTASAATLQLQSPLSESLRFRLGLATSRFDSYVGDVEVHRRHRPGASEPVAGALVDYHFNRWGLRFTGGALYSTPSRHGTLLSYDSAEANPATGVYDGAYINRYEAGYARDQVLPYLGLGWGQAFGAEQRLQFKMDFGIAFQGVTDLDDEMTAAESRSYGNPGIDPYMLDDQQRWESQFESLRYSFSAGVRYRF